MAIIFSDNFNNDFAAWDMVPSGHSLLDAAGCGGTRCYSCGNQLGLGIRKYFPTLQLDSTFRFNFAYYREGSSPSVAYLFFLHDFNGSHSQLQMLVNLDGSIEIWSAQVLTTAPGLVQTDGTWMAFQISMHCYKKNRVDIPTFINNVADIQIVINNVVVWSYTAFVISAFNYSSDPLPTGWDAVSLLAYREAHGDSYTIVAVDNFEIEDSVSIISSIPCTGTTKLYKDICIAPPTTGRLRILKETSPDSGSHVFNFIADGGLSPSTFSLTNGQIQDYTSVGPGTYSITEVPDPLWTPSYDLDNTDISIVAGSNVFLTVTNTGNQPVGSGIYFINPDKVTKHDSYYGPVEKKIPNPTVKTGLLGE